MASKVKYYIQVRFEDGELFVMRNTEERASFDSYEEAVQAAKIWKACRIVKGTADDYI